jgi:hypothetical protein
MDGSYMIKINLQKSCQILLVANIIFWLLIAFSSLLGSNNYLVIKLLLFIEPILYFVSLVGVVKKIKIIYLFSILLALGNSILSVTDQMGLSDIVSLILSSLVLLNLIFVWKNIFTNVERTEF